MDNTNLYYMIGDKKHFKWQGIYFSDGTNPYICKTEKEFNRIKKKYKLIYLGGRLWKVEV